MNEFHGHVQAVTTDTHGDEVAAGTAADATVLPVLDTADFDESGGVVRIADGSPDGILRDYLQVSDDPPTITLGQPAGALPAGTRIDVWDSTSGRPVVEYIADVVDDITGDLVQARITHSLVPLLEQAVRAGGSESVVCEGDDDGIWTVTNIVGRIPVADGTFTDPDTIPPPSPLAAPAAPALAAVTSTAYVAGRTPSSRFALSWDVVTLDVDGNAIEGEVTYEIDEKPAGGEWRSRTTAVANNVTLAPYQPGSSWSFRIRATRGGTDGRATPSEWSNEQAATAAADTTPPSAPTAPVLTTRLGALLITWDGNYAAGAPDDLDRVEVHLSATNGFTPTSGTLVGSLTAAGSLVRTDLPYNVTRYVRLVAVDLWGNRSAASAQSSVVIKPLVDIDLIGEVIAGANIKPNTINAADKIVGNTITGALIAALAIEAGHIKANAVTADKINAGAVTALKLSGDAIDGKTITGATVRTAATGERIVTRNDGSGGVIESFTGLAGETQPTVIDPASVPASTGASQRAGLRIITGKTSTQPGSAALFLSSGISDPNAADAGSTLYATAGDVRVQASYSEVIAGGPAGGGGRLRLAAEAVATLIGGSGVTLLAQGGEMLFSPASSGARFDSGGPLIVQGGLDATMRNGGVGTGTFRDSVDGRVAAVAGNVPETFAGGETITWGTSPVAGTPKRVARFTAVVTTGASGTFAVPMPGAPWSGYTYVAINPGDAASNLGLARPTAANHTSASVRGTAFTPAGAVLASGLTIRVMVDVVGW